MDKFNLSLQNKRDFISVENARWTSKINEILKLKRKFRSIKVDASKVSESSKDSLVMLSKVISKHGSNITQLDLSYARVINKNALPDIFKNLQMLEHLMVDNLRIVVESNVFKQIKIETLKRIETRNSSTKIFCFIKAPNLEMLEISNPHGGAEPMHNFLKDVGNLTTLVLNQCRLYPSSLMEMCKLRELKFSGPIEEINLQPFVESQASHLERLYVVTPQLSHSMLKMILMKLHNLKALQVCGSSFPENFLFYQDLKPLSLRTLHIYCEIPSREAFEGILSKCPKLIELNIQDSGNSVICDGLPFLSITNCFITSLHIFTIRSNFDAHVVFRYLKFLHVLRIESVNHWTNFIDNNPSIDTLSVGWVHNGALSTDLIDALLEQPNLRRLKIRGNFSEMKIAFDHIKEDYKQLQTLELKAYSKSIKLKFPSRREEWDKKITLREMLDRFSY